MTVRFFSLVHLNRGKKGKKGKKTRTSQQKSASGKAWKVLLRSMLKQINLFGQMFAQQFAGENIIARLDSIK